MLDENYESAKTIFLEYLELNEKKSLSWLIGRCGLNTPLFNTVMALIKQDATEEAVALSPICESILESSLLASYQASYGNYRVKELIGQGGMGNVFLGERDDGEFTKKVAIKVGQFRLQTEHHRARFLLERQTLADLEHTAICRLLDGGTTDKGNPYIVMEYIDGVPITQFCTENRLLIHDRLKLFIKVCEGVQYAHSHSVIHRDIKPDNILVTKEGDPKLIDFGVVRLITNTDEVFVKEVHDTTNIYTPAYASPEQLLGKKLTTATDIYSLGIVLYTLLTGNKPFPHTTLSPADIEKTRLAPPAPIMESRNKSDNWLALLDKGERLNDLQAIVNKAMSYDIHGRYETIAQFTNDIKCFLNDKPVSAIKSGLLHRSVLWQRRHKFASLMIVFCSILIVSSITLLGYKNEQLAYERDIAKSESQRAEAINELLLKAFKQVDPYNANGQIISAKDVLKLASAEVMTLNEKAPHLQLALHKSIGEVYLNLSSYKEARWHLSRAMANISEQATYRGVQEHILMGTVELGLGNLESATAYTEKAYQRIHPSDSRKSRLQLADVYHLQGKIFQKKAQWNDSIMAYQKAKSIYSSYGDAKRKLIRNNVFLAEAQIYNRSFEEAEKALLILQQQFKHEMRTLSPDYAQIQATIGLLYWYQNRWEEAENLFAEQLNRVKLLYGDYSDLRVNTAAMMATVKRMLKKIDESLFYHELAIHITEKKYGEQHLKMAGLLINYGSLLEKNGKFSEAESTLERALELARINYGENHDTTNYAKWTLGVAKGRLGKLEDCVMLLIQAENFFRGNYDSTEYPIAEIQQAIGIAYFFSKKLHEAEQYLQKSQKNVARRENANEIILNENLRYLTKIYETLGKQEESATANHLVEQLL
ncbi:serine/threonine-protein kinase [Alteromonas ponticola]|uniref:Serine/threonine-protein kinase n=1 Tax=Alteromonas aquimaris TaxID=2998417 RepID=A0ABT3P588_9ALTE|nr:serine/threonine-protein kinase [Alteromonas aquimaris]MCW8107932.1 serine/threonine-protein kinase [Alteromonas aquimaris]